MVIIYRYDRITCDLILTPLIVFRMIASTPSRSLRQLPLEPSVSHLAIAQCLLLWGNQTVVSNLVVGAWWMNALGSQHKWHTHRPRWRYSEKAQSHILESFYLFQLVNLFKRSVLRTRGSIDFTHIDQSHFLCVTKVRGWSLCGLSWEVTVIYSRVVFIRMFDFYRVESMHRSMLWPRGESRSQVLLM